LSEYESLENFDGETPWETSTWRAEKQLRSYTAMSVSYLQSPIFLNWYYILSVPTSWKFISKPILFLTSKNGI